MGRPRGGVLSFTPKAADRSAARAEMVKEAAGAASSGTSLEQKLKELKDLYDKKLITDEEYKASRKKILDNAVK